MTLDELITQRDTADLASADAFDRKDYSEAWRQELLKDEAILAIAQMGGASLGTIARARAAVYYSKMQVRNHENW